MKAVVVIADTGPLIALARIGHLHLLREIFSDVLITETVQQEVLLGGDFADSALLALDFQHNGQTPRLVMDEAKGRAAARSLSLELIGSAGIIATATRLGMIQQARPLLEALRASGYYLSQTVMDVALKAAGER